MTEEFTLSENEYDLEIHYQTDSTGYNFDFARIPKLILQKKSNTVYLISKLAEIAGLNIVWTAKIVKETETIAEELVFDEETGKWKEKGVE